MSQLLWPVFIIGLVSFSVVNGVPSKTTTAANAFGVSEFSSALPSVEYGGVYWSLADARLSPMGTDGLLTVIADVDVYNSNQNTSARFHRQALGLENQTTRIALERFANSESSEYLYLAPQDSVEITLAFKTLRTDIDLEDWSIVIAHKETITPATLPLVGDSVSEISQLELTPDSLIDAAEVNIAAGRAALFPNYRNLRALEGRTYLFVELTYETPRVPRYLDSPAAWSVSTDVEEVTALEVTVEQRDAETEYVAVFDVDRSASSAALVLSDELGNSVEFDILASGRS